MCLTNNNHTFIQLRVMEFYYFGRVCRFTYVNGPFLLHLVIWSTCLGKQYDVMPQLECKMYWNNHFLCCYCMYIIISQYSMFDNKVITLLSNTNFSNKIVGCFAVVQYS